MKVHHLAVAAHLFHIGISCGQNLVPASDLWSTEGSAAPDWASFVVGANINTAVQGSAAAGNWNLTGTGRSQLGVVAGPLTVLDIGTRAEAAVEGSELLFRLDNRVVAGSLDLEDLLGVGVQMGWDASYENGSFLWGDAQTIYTYSATIRAGGSLLDEVADLNSSINFSIEDGAGNVIHSLSGDSLLNALGITVLGDGTLVGISTGNSYTLNTTFAGGNYTDGLELRYSADSTVNTSLLEIGDLVLGVADVSIEAVPEPSAVSMSVLMACIGLFRRRRGRE